MLYDINEKRGSGCAVQIPMKSNAAHRFWQNELLRSAKKSEFLASSGGSEGEIIENMPASMCMRVLSSSTCYQTIIHGSC